MKVTVTNTGTNQQNPQHGPNVISFELQPLDLERHLMFSQLNALDVAWATGVTLVVSGAIKRAIREKNFNKSILVVSLDRNDVNWTIVVTE